MPFCSNVRAGKGFPSSRHNCPCMPIPLYRRILPRCVSKFFTRSMAFAHVGRKLGFLLSLSGCNSRCGRIHLMLRPWPLPRPDLHWLVVPSLAGRALQFCTNGRGIKRKSDRRKPKKEDLAAAQIPRLRKIYCGKLHLHCSFLFRQGFDGFAASFQIHPRTFKSTARHPEIQDVHHIQLRNARGSGAAANLVLCRCDHQ